MLGGAVGAGSPVGEGDLLTVTVVRDEHGYGMKVSGDNPVYVQSVKEHGAAWRAGLRSGDRILRVDAVPVHHHTHQQVVHMIRANPTTVLTVQQNSSRQKTPITAPVPVNSEKQRQLEASKVQTVRLMLEKEQKYIRDLRNELLKVPDVRKQAQLESAEQRCAILQHEIDTIMAGQPTAPGTPRLGSRTKHGLDKPGTAATPPNTGFLSGLPRSLSNLTNQSLRNLRQARQAKANDQPPLVRQNSDESANKRRHVHNNTVPIVPTTCLDNSPPPLPPRSIERPKRNPLSPTLSPPVNPLARPQASVSPLHKQYYKGKPYPMHQSMPSYRDDAKLRRSSHSLDGELDGPQPNSIALQMSYPLVNAPPPPLQTDNRTGVPVLHVRSQSSPEHLDHELSRGGAASGGAVGVGGVGGNVGGVGGGGGGVGGAWERGTPPPGTPPPPYAHNTQPCADPQRAIISMEEDDSPASDNSTYSGLFSNLRSVRESKARTAVLLNWLLGERRCACACLVLVLTDAYRAAVGAAPATLRRWAYEIHSTFLMPNAVLQLNGVDEHMANEIEHVLVNEFDKEELLRNVFRKARLQAKEELAKQLSEFQVKRQVGLGSLYGPDDAVLERCDVDKAQEQVVVERLMCQQLSAVAGGAAGCGGAPSPEAHAALLAALVAAALCLHCRPASVAAAVGGSRASFLQRDKLYKQRVKQITKQHPQPYVVRGHHLQLQALTASAHCHACDLVLAGLAPQAYVCTDCKLRVHRECAKLVEENCCLDGEQHHNNRISRFMERIHHQPSGQDSSDKKSRKASGATNFLNMERSFRKMEDEQPWDQTLTPASALERRDESDESLYESADCHSDAISASDDALPRLGKTPTISKESLKLAVTDEEVDLRTKKGHRKTMSLSNPLEMVKSLGDEWFDSKKDLEKHSDKKKSRESLWSEEDRDSIHGSTMKLDQIRKNSKKDDKNASENRKSSTVDAPKRKSSKSSSVSALNFLRRKKTPTSMKAVEAVVEVVDRLISSDEILKHTKLFLDEEKRHAAICNKPPAETDSEEDVPSPKIVGEHRRRLSRQTSRSKSKVRGKSQTVKVNTLRKSHSGTLKKAKKKGTKTPLAGRSRQASIVEPSPLVKKKSSDAFKQNSWMFMSSRAESRREGSTEEPLAPDVDLDTNDTAAKELPEKEHNWRGASGGRGVNRAESCRERDAPRRGKHRNASDPNRLTAHHNHDLEPGAATAPSGSSSSSSLSSRSNESNTVATEQQASQSDWSEEEEPLAAQWADSLPPQVLDSLLLSARMRKRQEVIHELIVSEGSHVRWLKVLGSVFLRPLENQPSLLPVEELRALFPNLPRVRERHARLYADLRAVRNDATNHIVRIRPVADAMLNTLGEAGYAACLSHFCRGQRMALDALRERRRKNKELHQFLAGREQLPLCGRLQLRDLLACVWQRLTKYQLLLEGIQATVREEGAEAGGAECDSAEDAATLRRALATAKEVLHSVDTAIRTAENEHRLRTIQNKLEVRIPGSTGGEWEELRRLDLTHHALRLEGELALRSDTNKKITVLALMLEEALVLLQREGDKFVLRPIGSGQPVQLSPLIKWDKVLFRPNAAVKNTFFLMNINGVQMHELSANTSAEYSTWVKHIQEAPLAKLTELKPSLTPSHQHTRSTDDSGINVSRNPSDASSSSSSGVAHYPPPDRDGTPSADLEGEGDADTDDKDRERDADTAERERERDKEEGEVDTRQRQATVGRISTHSGDNTPALETLSAITVREPSSQCVHTAHRAYSHQERLRRLDEAISRALRAKSAVVAELLGVPPDCYSHMAELAVAETLGQDVSGERIRPESEAVPDVHQLLLAAQAQASQLTSALSAALRVNEGAAVAARAHPSGRCSNCTARSRREHTETPEPPQDAASPAAEAERLAHAGPLAGPLGAPPEGPLEGPLDMFDTYDMLNDLSAHNDTPVEPPFEEEWSGSAARLAARLVGVSSGLQAALGQLAAALPPLLAERRALRAELVVSRERRDRRHDYQMTDDLSFPKGNVDQSMQDQPSNGG